MRKIIIPIIFALVLASCASGPSAVAYSDGYLIAEQRAEIEQLKRDLTDMVANQREVSDRIDSITARLTSDIERCSTVEDIFAEIDRFVQELVNENNELRKLQRSDMPADAGE